MIAEGPPEERIELLVNRCFILSDKTVEDPDPYGGMYTEWKAPKRVTNQGREDEIEKRRRNKVSFPLFLAIVGAVIFSVFVLIVDNIINNRNYRLLFVCFIIIVCLAFSYYSC